MNESSPDVDPRFEDVTKLSRRSLLKSAATGVLAPSVLVPSVAQASDAVLASARNPSDDVYWDWVADQFMLKPGLAYMNTGTRGPSPLPVYESQVRAIRECNEDRLGYVKGVYTREYKALLRSKLAAFIDCKPNEVAITNNTTEGMGIGTNGLDLKPGDEIIYTNHDHESGGQPVNLRCLREGLTPVVVDLSAPEYHPPRNTMQLIEAIEAAITPRTRLISFCHINYTDGCVMPVREICEMARERGIVTLVDGAHPPGMLDFSVTELGCDMYAGACHKWMLAALLTGFLYVREDIQDRIWPSIYSGPVAGKNMYGGVDDAEKGRTAERYETHGSINYAAGKSIDAAIDFQLGIGKDKIEARDRYMASRLRSRLHAIDGVKVFVSEDDTLGAGLVSFAIEGVNPKQLSEYLWTEHQVYIREVNHNDIGWNVNRASLHIMVTTAQVDKLGDLVEEVARKGLPS